MAGTTAGIDVQLGARTYSLVPQKIGRISRRLNAVVTVAQVATDEGGAASDVDRVTDRLYDALEVFIPDLAPAWELAGYGDEDSWRQVREHGKRVEAAREEYAASLRAAFDPDDPDRVATWDDLTDDERDGFTAPEFVDPYDEARDKSPTPPELVNAIEQIFAIHGGQRLVRLLKGLGIGADTIRPILRAELLRWASDRAETRSPSAPSPEDGAGLTNGSTQPGTPAASPHELPA